MLMIHMISVHQPNNGVNFMLPVTPCMFGGVPIGVDTDGRLTVNREPLAKLAELNEDRIEVSENDIETLKVKNNHFESLVGIASARIEELQDAIITMQGVYNGQIETLTNKLTALPKTVHASWDASTGNSFDWSTDEISSSGVSGVTRVNKGVYRISFSEDFSSTNYNCYNWLWIKRLWWWTFGSKSKSSFCFI